MKRGKGIIQNSSTVQTIQDVCINNIKLKKLTFTIRDGCLGSTFGIALRRDCSQGDTALNTLWWIGDHVMLVRIYVVTSCMHTIAKPCRYI